MKQIFTFVIFIFLNVSCGVIASDAQIQLPKGPVLNLVTGTSILYFETEIPFRTDSLFVDHYGYYLVSDSVDSLWTISSCFNGDCRGGIPDTGTFVKEFGADFHAAFIRFHINTMESDGKSVIKYLIYNHTNNNDQAELTFNITYKKSLQIKQENHLNEVQIILINNGRNLKIINPWLNPVKSIQIYNSEGKQFAVNTISADEISTDQLPAGVNVIVVKTDHQVFVKKFIRI